MMRTKNRVESSFVGLYNLTVWLKDGRKLVHKKVTVDNEQHRLGNIQVTDKEGVVTSYNRADIAKYQYDSKGIWE